MFLKIQEMLLNALNLLNCKFNITQRIFIEYIGKIIKRALEVFSSVLVVLDDLGDMTAEI